MASIPSAASRIISIRSLFSSNVVKDAVFPAHQLRALLPTSTAPASVVLPTLQEKLRELWDGILLAVPKNKTSYSRKRKRFMANNKLKDVTAMVHCSSCGRVKRMHILCPYCVANIKDMWAGRLTKKVEGSTTNSTGSKT